MTNEVCIQETKVCRGNRVQSGDGTIRSREGREGVEVGMRNLEMSKVVFRGRGENHET